MLMNVRFLKNSPVVIFALILIWVTAILLVRPVGNFPLGDDWCYAKSVKRLLETGEFRLHDWAAAAVFTQIFWGALFCLPFGFSFTALRISTLVLGIAGVIAVYGILREVGAGKKLSFLGALLLAINPIYFLLSHTFMTDVPFLALASISLFFFIKALRNNSIAYTVIGTFFACASTLTRQIGVAIPIAYGIAYYFRQRASEDFSLKPEKVSHGFKKILTAILPALITVGVLIIFITILLLIGIYPSAAGSDCIYINLIISKFSSDYSAIIPSMLYNVFLLFLYSGLFLIPFLLFRNPETRRLSSIKSKIITLIAGMPLIFESAYIIIFQRRLMPFQDFGGNVMGDFRLGAPTLKDVFIMAMGSLPKAPYILWFAITIVGLIGGFILFKIFVRRLYEIWNKHSGKASQANRRSYIIFAVSAIIVLFAPIALLDYIFDRYLFVFMPLLLVLIAARNGDKQTGSLKWIRAVAGFVFLFFIMIFTICGTHDYLSWNKARWKALNYLTERKEISPRRIDGGFEFNAWHFSGSAPAEIRIMEKSWWWVEDDEFIICFGAIPGYKVYKEFRYSRWLPHGHPKIYIMKKPGKKMLKQ